jgi:hypothetical protein
VAEPHFGEGRGGKVQALAPKGTGPHVRLTLTWHRGDKSPTGVELSTEDGETRTWHLIPWSVLPGRAKAQVRELLRYAGLDLPPTT